MEVLPLSLSRLQVLCHSLSKVLFKLSLQLLVRYRASSCVLNCSRPTPAARRCIATQRYTLGNVEWGARVSASLGYRLLWINCHRKGCVEQGLLCTRRFAGSTRATDP